MSRVRVCDCFGSNPSLWMSFGLFSIMLMMELSLLDSFNPDKLVTMSPSTLKFLIGVVIVATVVSLVGMGIFLFINLSYYHKKSKGVLLGS